MRLFILSISIIFLSPVNLSSQTKKTELVAEDEYIGAGAWQSRTITRRGSSVNRDFSGRREIYSELTIRKEANRSMRNSREILARKRFVRKEKSKIVDHSCEKKYNAYIQHDCLAHTSLIKPSESFELFRDELVVLAKQKKNHYELCILGETFYVFRKDE